MKPKKQKVCEHKWAGSMWETQHLTTSCKNDIFVNILNDDFKYCPFCGKEIKVKEVGMSLTKDFYGLLTFLAECDNCDEGEYQTDEEDFFSAIDEIKSYGWTVHKVKGQWEHWCPECSTKEAK